MGLFISVNDDFELQSMFCWFFLNFDPNMSLKIFVFHFNEEKQIATYFLASRRPVVAIEPFGGALISIGDPLYCPTPR